MSVHIITNENSPVEGMTSRISIMSSVNYNLFIREDNSNLGDATAIWLSNKTALELANWIMDNVETINDRSVE